MEEEIQQQRFKIAYISTMNPLSRAALRHTTSYIYRALEDYCGDITPLDPIKSLPLLAIGHLLRWGTRTFLRRELAVRHLPFIAKRHARMIERRLRRHSYDLLIAAETIPEIAYLRTDIPLILITDATFAQRHNYEPAWSRMLSWSAQQADAIESRAYNNAHALLLCSQWAARSIVQDYYIDPLRVYSVPFGAPLLNIPPKEIALTKRRSYRCTLLFIGDNWQHKGGDIAFQTLLTLEQDYAIKAELIICGTTPPLSVQHPRIKIFPTLDRSNEVQRNELERLYLRADFLLVPASSETTGIYCCEASAYGVPSLVADTGPLTEIISNGENGFVLPADAQATAYARIIAELYQNEQRYQALVRNSRRNFEERLNWDAWGKAVQTILQEIMVASPT